jgi:hypothetical protein
MTFFAHNEFNHFIGEEISAKKTQSRDLFLLGYNIDE